MWNAVLCKFRVLCPMFCCCCHPLRKARPSKKQIPVNMYELLEGVLNPICATYNNSEHKSGGDERKRWEHGPPRRPGGVGVQ